LQLGDLKQKIEESNGADPIAPCGYKASIPALLHFAYKYGDNGEEAILACANAGGENVGRAQVFGPLLGAFHGINRLP
jgi:ADP-ribosylglycohydrolase